MKKQSKKILIVSLIILAVLIVSFFALQIGLLFTKPQLLSVTGIKISQDFEADSQELIYQTYNLQLGNGICVVANPIFWCQVATGNCYGAQNTIQFTESVSVQNGRIVLNRGEPNSTDFGGWGAYPSSMGESCQGIPNLRGNGGWGLSGFCGGMSYTSRTECTTINNRVIDDCHSFSVSNVNDQVKCNAYCIPNKQVCIPRTLDSTYEVQTCSADGTAIIHKICLGSCSGNQCLGDTFSNNPIYIKDITLDDGYSGLDYTGQLRVYFNNLTYNNAYIHLILSQNGNQIGEIYKYSDSNGNIDFNFQKVPATGYVDLYASTNIKGVAQNYQFKIYFYPLPSAIINIDPLSSNYKTGDDVGANIVVKLGSNPFKNASLNVQLIASNKAILKEINTVTDINGEASINFPKVDYIGSATIKATTISAGTSYSATSSNILFTGNPFLTTISSSSLVQYDTAPVTFQVNIQDSFGTFYSPDLISNIRVSATLSSGSVGSPTWKYLGSGDYAITVPINGNGQLNGKLIWDYNGQTFSSDAINIQVLKDSISIDTSRIDPSGTVNQTKTFLISFSSASGRVIEPDKITIEVTHPSGLVTDIISQNNIVKISNGTYQVTYDNFREIEKYSFNIYADKSKYARGNALASVSVGGIGGGGGGIYNPVVAFLIKYIYWIIGIIVIGVGFFIWRKFKKK